MSFKKKIFITILIGVLAVGAVFGTASLVNANNARSASARGFGYGAAQRNGSGQIGIDGIANFLGVSKKTLISERQSGKSLAEIAEEHGKTAEQLKAFILKQADEHLNTMLKEGKITKEQFDAMKNRIEARVSEMISAKGEPHSAFGMRGENMHGNFRGEAMHRFEQNAEHHRGFARGDGTHRGYERAVKP